MLNENNVIVAIATAPGMGAIAVIRLSGKGAIEIADGIFKPARKGKKLMQQPAYTIHYGSIYDGDRELDQVLVSLFRGPHSYTGEDMVEISCHGSVVIQQQLLELLVRHGAHLAKPGEFTLRAFLNGKIDLSQAEAIADLIASTNETARRVAFNQMRGGISNKLAELRTELLKFTALVELELDFSEEDVEFADRTELTNLINTILEEIDRLTASFSQGNAIKMGIPVTIAGKPNVGKSTLLNRLLNEEKAIVSEIAGTTRDAIEDTIHLGGINFRFIDTAGIRSTTDTIESIGIKRAFDKIDKARIVLYLADAQSNTNVVVNEIDEFSKRITSSQQLIILVNKEDKTTQNHVDELIGEVSQKGYMAMAISAKEGHNIDALQQLLINLGKIDMPDNEEVIVTNARHYNALIKARESLLQVVAGLKANISGDLLTIDIYQALDYLGEITGQISNDEVLGYIFSKFCIGK